VKFLMLLGVALMGSTTAHAGIAGSYKAILEHQGTPYYQHAVVTLRSIQSGEELKIGGTIKVLFGDVDSQEFLTYDFDYGDVSYFPLQGGIFSMKNAKSEISIKGKLNVSKGIITGIWASSALGENVGNATASKNEDPKAPENGVLVRSLNGQYRGKITYTGASAGGGYPEYVSLNLVTIQELSADGPLLKVSGSLRLYPDDDFDSDEFWPYKLAKAEYGSYTRVLQTQTEKDPMTFKGVVSNDGLFKGSVSTSFGAQGTIELKRQE